MIDPGDMVNIDVSAEKIEFGVSVKTLLYIVRTVRGVLRLHL